MLVYIQTAMSVCVCESHRLSERQKDLSSEDMEVVSRRRTVHHDPVTVVELTHRKVLCEALREGERNCFNNHIQEKYLQQK